MRLFRVAHATPGAAGVGEAGDHLAVAGHGVKLRRRDDVERGAGERRAVEMRARRPSNFERGRIDATGTVRGEPIDPSRRRFERDDGPSRVSSTAYTRSPESTKSTTLPVASAAAKYRRFCTRYDANATTRAVVGSASPFASSSPSGALAVARRRPWRGRRLRRGASPSTRRRVSVTARPSRPPRARPRRFVSREPSR